MSGEVDGKENGKMRGSGESRKGLKGEKKARCVFMSAEKNEEEDREEEETQRRYRRLETRKK